MKKFVEALTKRLDQRIKAFKYAHCSTHNMAILKALEIIREDIEKAFEDSQRTSTEHNED